MKSLLILSLIALSALQLSAQNRVTGFVQNLRNKPVAGVSVSIKDTYDGATTDSSGKFILTTSEAGEKVLEYSAVGFKSYEEKVIISDKPLNLTVTLKESITELTAVVITAGSFAAGDQKKGTMLTALDIVTTAGANGEATGAIKTLPGAQQVGEAEGLFIRGGTATESKIMIDGTVVNNFFYSSRPGIASRGRFNPFLFKGTVFSSGGYSALYGQALSSALILESKDLPEKTEASIAISIIGGGGGIQKLAKDKRSSWGITYNYTNLSPAFELIPQKQDYFITPVYHNGDVNLRVKTRNGMIKYYGYANWSKAGFSEPDIDTMQLNSAFKLKNLNVYNNVNWKERLGKGWKLSLAFSYSNNRDNINNELQDNSGKKITISEPVAYALKNFDLISKSVFTQARFVMEKKLGGLNYLRFGADQFYNKDRSEYTLFTGEQFSEQVKESLSAGFAEADIYLTNNIAAKLGARTEYSRVLNAWNVAPRISLAYKLSPKSQMSFAYGIFYQTPENKYLPGVQNNITYTQAAHYILQYQKITNNKSFRAELFYKSYEDLIKTSINGNGRQVAGSNNGYGYAKGIELFWRDKSSIKDLDYWVSYSYLDTKRDFLNYPAAIQPAFAAEHTVALVMKKFVLPWKTGFNASYTYATGRPYYDLRYNGTTDKFEIKDQGKTVPYNNLSFSLNYLPKLGNDKARSFIVYVLSVSNVLGQKQVFTYNYATITNRKVEVGPPSKRFVYVGCFISFGVDRTQDAINNNL
jgi:hypothetical protein